MMGELKTKKATAETVAFGKSEKTSKKMIHKAKRLVKFLHKHIHRGDDVIDTYNEHREEVLRSDDPASELERIFDQNRNMIMRRAVA